MSAARTEHPYFVELLDPIGHARPVILARPDTLAEATVAFAAAIEAHPGAVVAITCGARIVRRSR